MGVAFFNFYLFYKAASTASTASTSSAADVAEASPPVALTLVCADTVESKMLRSYQLSTLQLRLVCHFQHFNYVQCATFNTSTTFSVPLSTFNSINPLRNGQKSPTP